MPRPQDIGPTYAEIMQQILDSADGPVPVKELSEQILALRPSTAKKPLPAIKNQIRQQIGHLLVFQDAETILPVRLAMQGARFRLQLDRNAINTGLVGIDKLASYLQRSFPMEKVRFIDTNEAPIEFHVKSITEKIKTPILGTYDVTSLYANLGKWLRNHKAYHKDSILLTVFDWQSGIFQLQHEPYAKHNAALLSQRNQLLADIFYEMLEDSAREQLYNHEAIPTAYARLPEKSGYPPEHWMIVLENDKRMVADDWSIHYREGRLSPLQELARELAGESREIPAVPFSKEQGNQVYRFRAALKHSPNIWREVEIQGKQTLADLNHTLVYAFNHDWDHMGGFWKLVPRKASTGRVRYREVELGTVDPFEGGDGADVKIAGIGLAEGDKLKFVFDFGDWIEHTLSLDAITSSQSGVDYPRETARNKPKYINCVECEQEGKQTAAIWICITCSNEHQKDMVYCETCSEEHEDHYLEEILY
jgi:hypothetical protein